MKHFHCDVNSSSNDPLLAIKITSKLSPQQGSQRLLSHYHPSQNSTSNAVQEKRCESCAHLSKKCLQICLLILLFKFAAPPVSSCVKVREPGQCDQVDQGFDCRMAKLDGHLLGTSKRTLFLPPVQTRRWWASEHLQAHIPGIRGGGWTHKIGYFRHLNVQSMEAKNFEPTLHYCNGGKGIYGKDTEVLEKLAIYC